MHAGHAGVTDVRCLSRRRFGLESGNHSWQRWAERAVRGVHHCSDSWVWMVYHLPITGWALRL